MSNRHLLILPSAFLLMLLSPPGQAVDDPVTKPAPERPSVALVLGGGGAHAVAHLGVLRELERQSIPIDLIVGNGFGGLIGGLYASGMTVDEIETLLAETDWQDIFNPDTKREDLSFRRKQDDDDFLIKYRVGIKDGQAQLPTALIPNDKLGFLLQKVTARTKGVTSFDDLPVPFRAMAMDLVTGELVALDSGGLDRAMLATLTPPGTLPPVKIDERVFVSGALLNNLPVDVARDQGAGVIIVVDVGVFTVEANDLNSVFAVVGQVAHLAQQENSRRSLVQMRATDILISPQIGPYAETDFSAI
jgi:NTE family protein